MSLAREHNESIKDYKIRLCKNKELYELTFSDIANLINTETGENKSESFFRRWWNGYNEGYNDAVAASIDNNSTIQEIEERTLRYEAERVKYADYRNSYKKSIRDDTRREIMMDIISQKISEVKPYDNLEPIPGTTSDNDLIIGLNDIHFGSNINNHWNVYNSDVAKHRLEEYYNNIVNIQQTHNSQSCYIFANGDLISGNIHPTIQISNRENVVQQIIGVSELIAWFLSMLSKHFKSVTFAVVSGNHSRLSTKDNSPREERLDDLIPWYIRARLQNFINITIVENDIDSSMNVVNIRGLNYLNIHGDYDNFNNVNRLVEMLEIPIYCIHFGHKHHNATESIQRYKIIMSGSLMGVDDYCIQKRIYGKAQQLVCVCNNKGIVCTYDVDLQ